MLTITRPDDWHLHLRDGDYLSVTVPATARQFARAIVMPNLIPAVTTVSQAQAYRERILAHIPKDTSFEPLMTLYLTNSTTPETIDACSKSGFVHALKLYPAGATTHSDQGIRKINDIYPVLDRMQKLNIPLLIHGESIDNHVDIFDREATFIDQELIPLIHHFPKLRIVLEHITTKTAVDFILQAPSNVAATITAHHLWLNRNDLLAGGIRPHYYCLPILKRQTDQQALINAATSGNKKFFLGTDSAPHAKNTKENACGCAGIFTAHAAIELYTQVFAHADALDQLENFASFNGADFYQLPRNNDKITLVKNSWQIAAEINYAEQTLIPFCANQTLEWTVTVA